LFWIREVKPSSQAETEFRMSRTIQMSVGELVERCYLTFLAETGDPELAALAASTLVNDLLLPPADSEVLEDAA